MRFTANDIPRLRLELEREFNALSTPKEPKRPFTCLEADLPDADQFPYGVALLTDTRTLAISTYTGSAWEWTRADGSAI